MSDAPRDEVQLDADAQALLDALREEDAMPPEVEARVWARLESTVGKHRRRWVAGAAVGAIAVAAATVLIWIGAGSVVEPQPATDAGAQAPFVAGEHGTGGGVGEPSSARPGGAASDAAVEPADGRVGVPDASAVDDAPAPDTATEPRTPRPRSRARQREAPAPTPDAEPSDSLAEEMALLGEARRVLSTGQPQRALALLDEHQRRFGGGMLGQERDALRVVALCDAGRIDEGHRAARRYLAQHPGGALAERVRQACAQPITDAGAGGL